MSQKVAVVTGSSSGMGYETSLILARNGFHTYASMRKLDGDADDEYQRCSPAYVATGATHSPDGRRVTINVEVLGGSILVSHFKEEITDKHHVRLASVSDSFTPTGRTTLHVIWDMSVKYIHSRPTEEFLEFLAKQGIPFEQFKQARQPVSAAHNRQETPLFAASIERASLNR
jgi:hypothetical protein